MNNEKKDIQNMENNGQEECIKQEMEQNENMNESAPEKTVSEECDSDVQQREEIEALEKELEEIKKKNEEQLDMLQRIMAEFDNYKKRTAREKESLYNEAAADTVFHFIPVLDNLERAVDSCKGDVDVSNLLQGVELVLKQFKEVLSKLGVEEIKAKGEVFDPELHNAVMHIEDESVGENIIVEEFQKGYKMKDKIIRYSMVKVAN